MEGEIEKAREEYKKAVALVDARQATYIYPLEGLARLCWQQQQAPEALRYAQVAVQRDPKLASGHLILGNMYLQTGEKEKAVIELKIAADLDPADPAPHYVLAKAYRKLAMSSEAQHEEGIFMQLKRNTEKTMNRVRELKMP
jgi:predicted Zn-dependent protease